MLNLGPSNDDLLSVIKYAPAFRDEAWKLFLAQRPSNYDLLYVIENVPALRDEAKSLLVKGQHCEHIVNVLMRRSS